MGGHSDQLLWHQPRQQKVRQMTSLLLSIAHIPYCPPAAHAEPSLPLTLPLPLPIPTLPLPLTPRVWPGTWPRVVAMGRGSQSVPWSGACLLGTHLHGGCMPALGCGYCDHGCCLVAGLRRVLHYPSLACGLQNHQTTALPGSACGCALSSPALPPSGVHPSAGCTLC